MSGLTQGEIVDLTGCGPGAAELPRCRDLNLTAHPPMG
jgi:hypothetical protein